MIVNRTIHTRSTKCQYSPSVSIPWWFAWVYLPRKALPVTKAMQTTPQKTWKPWNPVVVKKTDPKSETCGLNPSWRSFQYSTPWIEMKVTPKRSVRQRKSFIFRVSPREIAARDWTIVTDEHIRMNVFIAVNGMFRTD